MKSILIPMMSSGLRQTTNLALKADYPPSGRLILAKRLPSILPAMERCGHPDRIFYHITRRSRGVRKTLLNGRLETRIKTGFRPLNLVVRKTSVLWTDSMLADCVIPMLSDSHCHKTLPGVTSRTHGALRGSFMVGRARKPEVIEPGASEERGRPPLQREKPGR